MSKRGYKEWARHLRPEGKRAAAKAERRQARGGQFARLLGLETVDEGEVVRESVPHEVIEPGDEDEDCLWPCPQCNGRNEPLGALGRMMHYSCRWCGWGYSRTSN